MNKKFLRLITFALVTFYSYPLYSMRLSCRASINVTPPPPMRLESSGYKLGKLLGSGAHGKVFRATDLSNRLVAIKITCSEKKSDRHFNQELHALKTISPFFGITHLVDQGVYTLNTSSYDDCNNKAFNHENNEASKAFVMEFVEGKQPSRRDKYSIPELYLLLGQLLPTLVHTHRSGFMHRDIKPGNLLVNKDTKVCKLCDWGSSIQAGLASDTAGSPCYMAPEIVQQAEYSNKVDIWSLGVTLYELVTGQELFYGSSNSEIFSKIMIRQMPCHICPKDTDLENLISSMLKKDQKMRSSSEECIQSKAGRKSICLTLCHIHHSQFPDRERQQILDNIKAITGINTEEFEYESSDLEAETIIARLGFNPNALRFNTLEEQFAALEAPI